MSQIPSPPRPRVVLAEDDTLLLEAFSRLLAPNFEVVGTASDGDEAVSVALRVKPDLVLLDARMPRSSGFEAARRLRTELPGVPIVFLTGIRDPQLAAEAFSAGATAYILKDSTPKAFEAALWSALRGETTLAPGIAGGDSGAAAAAAARRGRARAALGARARRVEAPGRGSVDEAGRGRARDHGAHRGVPQVPHHGDAVAALERRARGFRGPQRPELTPGLAPPAPRSEAPTATSYDTPRRWTLYRRELRFVTRSGTSDPPLPSAVTSRDETSENRAGTGKEAG